MSRRTVLRVLGAVLLILGVVAGGAGPAWAHADLQSTEPAYGDVLPSGPRRALLRYDLAVDVNGAQVTLEQGGKALPVAKPVHASLDRRNVSVSLPALGKGSYVLTWFLFGADGDVMGGELAFTVAPAALLGPAVPGPAPARPGIGTTTAASSPNTGRATPAGTTRSFAPLSRAQDAARLLGTMSLTVLVGGVTFVAGLWRAGARVRRARVLLWASLAGALMATAAALGLKGAAVTGQSALGAFSPAALTALNGTNVGRALVARLVLLLVAAPVLTYLTMAPRRALRSRRWAVVAIASAVGLLATHGMLSHAYARGPLATAAHIVHLGAVTVWLGGLAMLAFVVLPRRRRDELSRLVPRWSRLAFAAVATAAVAGTILLVLIAPRWTALPGSGYGRILALKLTLVAVLLGAAARARGFVRRRLPSLTSVASSEMAVAGIAVEPRVLVGVGAPGSVPPARPSMNIAVLHDRAAVLTASEVADKSRRPPETLTVDPVPLRPFVTAVTAELCIAASILTATVFLVSRSPLT